MHARRSKAFTLIEILVVLAIIAVLAALLLPGLARAKGKAQATTCLNHVRQWALGISLYLEECSDVFPYEGNPARIDEKKNVQAWYNVVTPFLRQPALMELYAKNQAPVPGSRSVFTCPNTVQKPTLPLTVHNAYFMYGFNRCLDPNDPDDEGIIWLHFRLNEVTMPSSTVLMGDSSETRYPTTSGRYAPARHYLRANLAFVDGHAEAVHTNDYRRTLEEDTASIQEWSKPRKVYWFPYSGAPE